jgi:hypothetical protein
VRKLIFAAMAAGAVSASLALGATGALASGRPAAIRNATNACGSACVDIHFLVPGKHALVTSKSGYDYAGNLVRLTEGSNGAAKQDFTRVDLSTVAPLYCTASGQAEPGSVFTPRQCALLDNAGLLGATTFQLAFNPYGGGPETLCVGSQSALPQSGAKARLEPCGLSGATVLIETSKLPTGTATAGSHWLISGGSDNFSNPLVLTSTGAYPSNLYWETVVVNGGKGQDTQEVRLTAGPFTV